MTDTIRGYAEGYYGRLPSWQEREALLQVLAGNGQDTYYYAPKEDACHRLNWREPYDDLWRQGFRMFCRQATELGIRVVAGVAPGLDFDFGQLDGGADFTVLLSKCRQLKSDGAHALSLLMDDIDADFHRRCGGIASEGQAHALLANRLQEALGEPLWVTPRIYANELAAGCPDYLPDFLATLDDEHSVLYCGSDIVARQADVQDLWAVAPRSEHRLVLWDNLYANDYCPQRLFVGAWSGRESVTHCLLNPTGMPATDHLLLDLMAEASALKGAGGDGSARASGHGAEHGYGVKTTTDDAAHHRAWQAVLARHGVPDEFLLLAPWFHHPVFNGDALSEDLPVDDVVFAAIETCLWRWKTPLSREWYPYLFNLKLDLLLQTGRLSPTRLRKTRLAPLAVHLLNR